MYTFSSIRGHIIPKSLKDGNSATEPLPCCERRSQRNTATATVFRIGFEGILGGPGDLVSGFLSRVISTLNGVTPNYNPTYNRLTKSPGPPSTMHTLL